MDKKYFSGTEILNFKIEGDLWLWDEFLPAKGLACLCGASDCGKSTFLRQLALAVSCRNEDFLGQKLNVRTGKVVYVSTEDGANGTKYSFEKQAEGLGLKEVNSLYFLFDIENLAGDLKANLKDEKVDLIVIDAWSDVFSGNPNDFTAIRKHMKELKLISKKYNCCVILLHHSVKNAEKFSPDKNKLNGSQAIEASVRSLLELRMNDNDQNQRLLTLLKGNYISPDKKNVAHILKLNEHMLFEATNNTISFRQDCNKGKETYDPDVWVPRMKEVKDEGTSYEKAIEELKRRFPEDAVPGKTWFIEKLKVVAA